jgi:hypothetical protein
MNGEQGWQWDNEGKCYLASEEGSDDAAKEKAIKQAIAAGASEDEFSLFADLKNVELFRPGIHNGMEFTDEDIDKMISSTNACLPFIRKSIEEGLYRENPGLNAEIKKGKPIPALINLGHQRYFKDIKTFLKDLSIDFERKGEWITANIKNVKDDIALMLQEVFSGRSVELIKCLFNPDDGKVYHNVIRSIGFLPDIIPPAVSGQNPNLAVEFQADNFHTLCFNAQYYKEELNMATQNVEVPAKESQVVDILELEAQNQKIQEMQLRLDESEKAAKKAEEEKQKLQEMFQLNLKKQEEREIEEYCKDLASERIQGTHGHEFILAQSFVDSVKSVISGIDNSETVEFAGTQKTSRQAVQDLLSEVIKMSAENILLVPVGGLSQFQKGFKPPEEKKPVKPLNEAIMEFYGEKAKGLVKDPNNKNQVYLKAHELWALEQN